MGGGQRYSSSQDDAQTAKKRMLEMQKMQKMSRHFDIKQTSPAQYAAHQTPVRNVTTKSNAVTAAFSERTKRLLDDQPRSERQTITDGLEIGGQGLILEYNKGISATCSARKCLCLEYLWNTKIQGPYRIRLDIKARHQDLPPEWEQYGRRFFHVACLETIGVDIAKYIKQPTEFAATRHFGGLTMRSSLFHPAITHWIKTKGKAFEADQYTDSGYGAQVEAWWKKTSEGLGNHLLNCESTRCQCPPPPPEPNVRDFIKQEPAGRSLTDVLLHVVGAGDLMPLLETDMSLIVKTLDGVEHNQTEWLNKLRALVTDTLYGMDEEA